MAIKQNLEKDIEEQIVYSSSIKKLDILYKYALGIALSIAGYMIQQAYCNFSENLARLNQDIVTLRIQVSKIQSEQMSEERVKNIVQRELYLHRIK